MITRFTHFKILFIVLSLAAVSHTNAQSVHADYFDGRIYLSISHDCQVDISPDFIDSRASSLLPGQQQMQGLFRKYGVKIIDDYFKNLKDPRFDKVYELTFSNYFQVDAFIAELERDPCIVYAEKVPIMSSSYVPSDTRLFGQWTLDAVEAYEAWDLHREPTREVVIAIVDDAVRIDHEDLQPNLWINTGEIPGNGIDDDNNGYIDDVNGFDVFHSRPDPSPPFESSGLFSHGTHCAGIASASTDNNIGIASLGYNCKIMSVKAKRDNNESNTIDNTTAGVVYAVANNPDVISMSFGGGGGGNTIQNVFTLAHERGILCLSSSGNSNSDLEFYPAAYRYVYSVSSTAPGFQKSGFSNYGDWIDISAPGSGILSTVAGGTNTYTEFSGTSMACPNAAGLAGYLFGYHKNVVLQDVLDCLINTADNIDEFNPGFEGLMGSGQINARKAIECLVNKPPTPRAEFPRVHYVGTPITFKDKSLNGKYSKWKIGDEINSELEEVAYTFQQTGRFAIELEIDENISIVEDIVILPKLKAPYDQNTNGYSGDFEVDAGHFAALIENGSPLVRGRSSQALKDGTNSGDFAYVLAPDQPNYLQESKSYLYTPMFEFEDQAMYELSFFTKFQLNTGLDGFHVEYSEDNGISWQKLGTDRSDWYNYTNNALGIGAYQLGESYFSGRQSTFKKFRWNVSRFNQKTIAFRFSFNSQDRGLASGFALDDFVIIRSDEEPLTVLRSLAGQFTPERKIKVEWSTRPEYFCKGFWVESSLDGRSWERELYVDGHLFDLEVNNYSWTSLNVRNRDLHFFRLWVENVNEATDYDESFYSDVIVVRKNLTGVEIFQFFPNPFTDFVHLIFTDLISSDLDYVIFDISGKEVGKGTQAKGQGYYQIDIRDVPAGVYLLNLNYGENSTENTTLKIVKQ